MWKVIAVCFFMACASPQKQAPEVRLTKTGNGVLQICKVPVVYFLDKTLAKDVVAVQKGFSVWNTVAERTLFEYGGELDFNGDYPPLPFMAVEANDTTTACGHTNMVFIDAPGSDYCVVKAYMELGADCRLTPPQISTVVTHEAGHLLGLADVYSIFYDGVMTFRIKPPLERMPNAIEQEYVKFRYGKTRVAAP